MIYDIAIFDLETKLWFNPNTFIFDSDKPMPVCSDENLEDFCTRFLECFPTYVDDNINHKILNFRINHPDFLEDFEYALNPLSTKVPKHEFQSLEKNKKSRPMPYAVHLPETSKEFRAAALTEYSHAQRDNFLFVGQSLAVLAKLKGYLVIDLKNMTEY